MSSKVLFLDARKRLQSKCKIQAKANHNDNKTYFLTAIDGQRIYFHHWQSSMMAPKSSKRRKVATCPIYDLFSDGILKEVASFLAAPSRALFAVAITPPISPYDKILARCRPRHSRSPITDIDDDWHTLDFGDIEKELAAKLTDEDISKVLLHVDAAHRVKRLLLTNCVNITGAGLSPLRHSTSIEQIDMSLVKVRERPELHPVPPLSCDQVLPILHGIISQERNSLKNVQFPHSWRRSDPVDPQLVEYLRVYNQMLENRTIFCKKCNKHTFDSVYFETSDGGDTNYFGLHDINCSVCTNTYCYSCTADDDGDYFNSVRLCFTCERCYCSKCSTMVECVSCEEMYCVRCMSFIECASPWCERPFCNHCRLNDRCMQCKRSWCYECDDCMDCSACGIRRCVECSMEEGVNGVHSCDDCERGPTTLCDKCRMKRCQSSNECKSCTKMVSSLILAQNKTLHVENTSLKKEVKDLKLENEEMKGNISMARLFLTR